MVDIMPYTEDDDDESDWIPLTANTPVDCSSLAATSDARVTAAVSSTSRTSKCARHDAGSAGNSKVAAVGRGDETRPRGDLPLWEDSELSESDHGEWRALSSPPATASRPRRQPSRAWAELLAAHLVSAPQKKTRDVASSEEEEDAVWIRPDGLGGDGVDIARRRSSIGNERDDEKTPTATSFAADADVSSDNEEDVAWVRPDGLDGDDDDDDGARGCHDGDEHPASRRANGSTALPPTSPRREGSRRNAPRHREGGTGDGGDSRFRRVPGQRRRREQPVRQLPFVASELREKLIRDPLRALPFRFVAHFYGETTFQFAQAWNACRERNEASSFLAPLSLFAIVGLFGACLIGTGMFGLGSLVMRAAVQAVMSLSLWAMETALDCTVFVTCASLFLMAILWTWWKIAGRDKPRISETDVLSSTDALPRVPSIATLLPWAMALSCSSLYEVCILTLYLRTCLPIITTVTNLCASDQPAKYFGTFVCTTCAVGLLFAVTNAIAASIVANALEPYKRKNCGTKDDAVNISADTRKVCSLGPAEEVPSANSSNVCTNAFAKGYTRILRHCDTCHFVSILSLAALSVIISCIQVIYMHYVGNVIHAIGTMGYSLMCIGSGVAVLVALWNVATAADVTSKTTAVLGVTFRDIIQISLKKCILEVSASTVWGPNGIISDNDGALRCAIFDWAIDRWIMASSTSAESTTLQLSREDSVSSPTANCRSEESATSTNFHEHGKSGSTSTSTGNPETALPSYQSLQRVIAKLDADEALIPAIERYRTWVFSLPPSEKSALYLALWKMCPATVVLAAVAVWCLGSSFIDSLLRCVSCSLGLSSWSTNDPESHRTFLVSTIMLLLPLLFLEYQWARRWWTSTTSRLARQHDEVRPRDKCAHRDIAMTLLRVDENHTRSQSVFYAGVFWERAWILLLESIAVLESSIPAVRCATVACAAADLTNDTFSLFDLALEVRKRGFLGGAWLFVNDAFHYHYKKELERRTQNISDASSQREHDEYAKDCDSSGGKYTGAVASAIKNLGKVTHNISCLIEMKNGADELSKNHSGQDDVPIESIDIKGTDNSLNQASNHFEKQQSADLRKNLRSNSPESDKCMPSGVNRKRSGLSD